MRQRPDSADEQQGGIGHGDGPHHYAIGKPNPLMMRLALRQLDVRSQDTVMIGDRMDTDIIAGIESSAMAGVIGQDRQAKCCDTGHIGTL